MKLSINAPITFTVLLSALISCNKTCPSDLEACQLEPDSGPCEAAITKYYFDTDEEKCKSFLYGGCDGTVPFDSMEECLQCECN